MSLIAAEKNFVTLRTNCFINADVKSQNMHRSKMNEKKIYVLKQVIKLAGTESRIRTTTENFLLS